MRDPQREKEVGLILKATAFAALKHRDQRRKDAEASPYINHPIALADVLWQEGGVRNAVVIAAALLHDTIEDTKTTATELRRVFGDKVAGIVVEVTDDKRLPKERRKELQIEHAARISKSAKLVKLADKICNLRDILESPPKDWPIERKRQYFDWAKKVIDQVRGTNAKLERRFDRLYRKKPGG
jgi:GTP diphosphokinase / guanosine-3',5'-bis(diphosphate) 3'-diphosphatase